jgi:hypothetical protein
MSVTLKSTKAKVRDPEKVRAVLDSYALKGVEIELREEGSGWFLEMAYHDGDPEWWEWPVAVRPEQLPSEEQYADEEAFDEAEDDVYEEKGHEGFLALLRDLAPHLESALLILFSLKTLNYYDHAAQAWHVQPGATEVETLEVL